MEAVVFEMIPHCDIHWEREKALKRRLGTMSVLNNFLFNLLVPSGQALVVSHVYHFNSTMDDGVCVNFMFWWINNFHLGFLFGVPQSDILSFPEPSSKYGSWFSNRNIC